MSIMLLTLIRIKDALLLKIRHHQNLILQAMFLIALTFIVYSPSFFGSFIFDDIGHIFEDRRLRTFSGLMKIWLYPFEDYQHQYYPLTSTTLWLAHSLWGFKTLGFHLINVSLHSFNALLLWRLLSQLKVPGGYWGAMIFAVSPVNVQSVAWIIELKNVQSCFFYLASAVIFVQMLPQMGRRRWALYGLSLGLFILALLSKAATSSLPLGLLLILFWKRRETFWRDFLLLIPYAIIGGGFASFVKHLEENFSGAGVDLHLSLADRWVLLGQTLWFYASKLVLPIDIRFIYARWQVDATQMLQWLPTLGLILVLGLFVKMRKKWGNGPLVGLLYFFAAVGPLVFMTVAYMRFSYVANHWVYWASLGFTALMATAVAQIFTHQKLRVAVMLVIVCALGTRSWFHAHLYEGPTAIWSHVLEANPVESMAYLNLANDLRKTDTDKSSRMYQLALTYSPYSHRSLFGLGTLYLVNNQPELCRFYTTQALFYSPGDYRIQFQNARARIVLGQVDECQKLLEKILKRKPDQFESIVLLAHVYLIHGRVEDARKLADQAIEIDPEDHQTRGIVGMIQARDGLFEEAKGNLLNSIMRNPKFSDGLLTLGVINHQQGHLGIAIMYYRRALAVNDDAVAANEKLGLALWEQGHWAEALMHCRKAYDLDTARILAGRRAADALGHLGRMDEAKMLFEKLQTSQARSPQLINERAWLLAVMGKPESLPLALQVAQMTQHQVALVLDTLAAAYATTGDFKNATHWCNEALVITGKSGEATLEVGLKARLKSYEQKQRWSSYSREAEPDASN
ncbi:MAG: tetratricopeptide repeat protein [Phycisphaeraceae bacterium]|nr:tetratricopeptide repeat protein [Phycisphaeraceae bacterium]